MPVERLKTFLDENGVRYVTITHSPAYTAQEIAASAHIPGRDLAKTVMIEVDGKMAMAVLPASQQVDLEHLAEKIGAKEAKLASEAQFKDLFPECEVGAMPPFGNLYSMDVYVSKALTAEKNIAFNAGSHVELVRLPLADFERLVKPQVVDLGATG